MKVGKINLKSGTVIVTDPCYNKGIWCSGSLDNVKKGEWNCFLKKSDESGWGIRNAEIKIIHNDIKSDNVVDNDIKVERSEKLKSIEGSEEKYIFWELTDIDVGVDSGQAGIFDNSIYPNSKDERGKYGDTTKFYGKCCQKTGGGNSCGIIDGGFVSSSGYGDGSYTCYVAKKDDEIVAIKIEFIGEE